MALVDEHQRRRRQVVDQRRRRLARPASRQVPRVVLDALAETDLGHHLEIEARALLDALRLDQLHLRDEEVLLLHELDLDRLDGVEHLLPARHVVARREHGEAPDPLRGCARSAGRTAAATRSRRRTARCAPRSRRAPPGRRRSRRRGRGTCRAGNPPRCACTASRSGAGSLALRRARRLPSRAGSCCGIRTGRRCRRSPTPSRRSRNRGARGSPSSPTGASARCAR